ncbi:BSD domain-containing protein [Cardiosporidium cionae]|uniref:BSD domain-containing protein n=1 Tax=Cardiosporidium cionae TaxID=476202 RepID=A0ABQ7JGE1_9APIC|nr:BSD domain-containing protein [Cardiosporidium cionae]|eukprot:KAF8823062.1 BSD domain-containing protein [Cardiosporidium cionae]
MGDVELLTEDGDTFLYRCPKSDVEEFSFDDHSDFLEWSQFLLRQVPSLAAVRYALVPKRISEDEFWKRYYTALREIVIAQIEHTNKGSIPKESSSSNLGGVSVNPQETPEPSAIPVQQTFDEEQQLSMPLPLDTSLEE